MDVPELLVVVAEDMTRKGKKVDKFRRLVWNKEGIQKIDRMLYNGCEIVEGVQCYHVYPSLIKFC